MKVLIGGEHNGFIRDAFIAEGHTAMSCDFRDTIAPGPHYRGDWNDVLFDGWDLAIFHFTCTYMANSGAKHLFQNRSKNGGLDYTRWIKMGEAAWDVWKIQDTLRITRECRKRGDTPVIPHVAFENPVMLRYAQILSELERLEAQSVQPWWFGDDPDGPDNVKKQTCWWTFNPPKLVKTGTLDGSTAREEVFHMTPTADPEERRMARSKFHPGHAKAIASQWGAYVAQQIAA